MIFNDRFPYTKYRGLSYIAGTNKAAAVGKILEKNQGTTIGVMDNQGNILKKIHKNIIVYMSWVA